MEGYSWPRLVISLPASHFSYFSALSAIWQTAQLETANGRRQKATGQQGGRIGMGECGTCPCANRQTSKWILEGILLAKDVDHQGYFSTEGYLSFGSLYSRYLMLPF
ncbi:uncharacterized protein LOC122618952 [Drosophila teissieri]|uniref:uncharacterized protein LOC122618952 n=1 Tax=Drosophila teissieri TaxID=7243 RepID=UPI001CBA0D09|nr:uncharacterized protein LOC122618952 [Drosophila teissieri]